MHVGSKNSIIDMYDVLSGNGVLLLSGNDVLFRLILVFSGLVHLFHYHMIWLSQLFLFTAESNS